MGKNRDAMPATGAAGHVIMRVRTLASPQIFRPAVIFAATPIPAGKKHGRDGPSAAFLASHPFFSVNSSNATLNAPAARPEGSKSSKPGSRIVATTFSFGSPALICFAV